ncbi:MAG TPA: tetratricopeptide repeat protein [Streptosporangiaceae bacterium]|nr:tetratricopeptide repeat protein [Streptosporangiaceae bacterium]
MLSGMRQRRAAYYYRDAARLARLGRHGRSLAALNRVLALVPGDTGALMLRGAELAALDRDAEALDAFDEVLARSPGHAAAHHNRAMTLARLGRRDEALAAHDQAVACEPGRAYFRTQKGIALVAAGGLDQALAEFDAACGAQPEAAGEAAAWAGAIMWHRGDAARARERFSGVRGRVTETTAARAAELDAISRCALGDPESAERALRAAGRAPSPERLAALYALLCDPPLAGIDRLRDIAARPASRPSRGPG